MMKAMRFSIPTARQLVLAFNVDGTGVVQLGEKAKNKAELLKVIVDQCECASTKIDAARMLAIPCMPCSGLRQGWWRAGAFTVQTQHEQLQIYQRIETCT